MSTKTETILLKRGLSINLDNADFKAGEPAFTLDTKKLYIGYDDEGNYVCINPDLGTAAQYNVGTDAGEIPVILSNGKLDTSIIPNMAFTNVYVVNSEAEMLALDCSQGSIAVRTDVSETFILANEPSSTLSNWVQLLFPGSAVISVNGMNGEVILTGNDIQLGTYTPPLGGGIGLTSTDTLNEVIHEFDFVVAQQQNELSSQHDDIQFLYGVTDGFGIDINNLNTKVTALEAVDTIDGGTF